MAQADVVRQELAAKSLAEINTGIKVKMYSPECEEWRTNHENCSDCPYELACSKMLGIGLAVFTNNPNDKIDEVLASQDISKIDFDFKDIYPDS